jgi:hypothetical protein
MIILSSERSKCLKMFNDPVPHFVEWFISKSYEGKIKRDNTLLKDRALKRRKILRLYNQKSEAFFTLMVLLVFCSSVFVSAIKTMKYFIYRHGIMVKKRPMITLAQLAALRGVDTNSLFNEPHLGQGHCPVLVLQYPQDRRLPPAAIHHYFDTPNCIGKDRIYCNRIFILKPATDTISSSLHCDMSISVSYDATGT